MPNAEILAQLGAPFAGLNTQDPTRDLKPSQAVVSSNICLWVQRGALTPVPGRTQSITAGSSGATTPFVGIAEFFPSNATGVFLSQGGNTVQVGTVPDFILVGGPGVTVSGGASIYTASPSPGSGVLVPLVFPVGMGKSVLYTLTWTGSNQGATTGTITATINGTAYTSASFNCGMSGNPKFNKLANQLLSSLQGVINAAAGAGIGLSCGAPQTVSTTVVTVLVTASTITTATAGSSGIGAQLSWTAGGINTITLTEVDSPLDFTQVSMEQYGDWMFMSNGGVGLASAYPPIKVDLNSLITPWQITPPSQTATLSSIAGSAGAVGNYFYRYTLSNSQQESSPSIVLPGPANADGSITVVSGNKVHFVFAGSVTGDPQVAFLNLYRLGGSIGQWVLISTTAITPGSTPTIPDDNAADATLTGQNLILRRDPPANFQAICSHKDRMWGLGVEQAYTSVPGQASYGPQTSDLWYSNYAEPWGFDSSNQIIPISRETEGDVGVALVSLGSVLVVMKSKTTWAVYGDDPTMFRALKMFDVGCASMQGVTVGEGVLFWPSATGAFMFDGSSLTRISGDIQKTYDALGPLQLSTSQGFYYRHTYFLGFPGNSGVTYFYDTQTKQWGSIPYAPQVVAYDPETFMVMGVRFNTVIADRWFEAGSGPVYTDLGGAISFNWSSGIFSDKPEDSVKQSRYMQIFAPPTSGSQPINFLLTWDPGRGVGASYTVPYDLQGGNATLSLKPIATGVEMQVNVNGTSTAYWEIDKILFRGWAQRQMTVLD